MMLEIIVYILLVLLTLPVAVYVCAKLARLGWLTAEKQFEESNGNEEEAPKP